MMEQIAQKVPMINRAMSLEKLYMQDEQHVMAYRIAERDRMDRQSSNLIAEKRGIKIGEKRGMEIGRTEGLEQGLEQGLERGKLESIKIVVKNLGAMQMKIDEIASIVGLSVDELKEIMKNG